MAFTAAGIVVARRVVAGAIDIPGINQTGFHVDASGNMSVGGATATSGAFTVTSAGAVTASTLQVGTITGVSQLTWGSASSLGPGDFIDLPTSSGFNTPARVQKATGRGLGGTDPSLTASFGGSNPATAGNLLVAVFVWAGNVGVGTAPAGYTLAQATTLNNNGPERVTTATYWKVAAGGETNVTGLFPGGTGGVVMFAEYRNIAAVPQDQTANNTGTSANPRTGTTGATTQTVELLIGALGQVAAATPNFSGPINGFSIYAEQGFTTAFGTGIDGALIDRVVSATGAYQGGAGSNKNNAWVGQIVTFKASGPGTGVSAPASGTTRIYGTLRSGTTTVATVPAAITAGGSIQELADGLTSQTATTSATNATTDVLGPSVTIPANAALQGGALELFMFGDIDSSAAPPAFRWRFMLDGAQLFAMTVTPTISVNNGGWVMRANVIYRSIGAGGTFWRMGELIGDGGIFGAANRTNIAAGTATVAIDTTAARVFDLRANMQAAVAANTLRIYGGWVRWAKY